MACLYVVGVTRTLLRLVPRPLDPVRRLQEELPTANTSLPPTETPPQIRHPYYLPECYAYEGLSARFTCTDTHSFRNYSYNDIVECASSLWEVIRFNAALHGKNEDDFLDERARRRLQIIFRSLEGHLSPAGYVFEDHTSGLQASGSFTGEAFFSLNSISPTLERMANYGYYMLGYSPPNYGHDDEIDLYEKEPLWDGHIGVGNLLSPIFNAIGAQTNELFHSTDEYGRPDRVVKGFDNRLGLRIALPYVGDFQMTREIGPGRFLDKLGPGKYPYSHLPPKGGVLGGGTGHGYGSTGYGGVGGGGGYGSAGPSYASNPVQTYQYVVKPTVKGPSTVNAAAYQSMQNYPWYYR
ncbi:uncharacterized protein [Macrobrachium rosenbergii]|uniref:uncharacterized protein n=1 Tax=Macrobrachium rosenbergii TaxID=79674 RepID=UPI0034D6A205